MTAAGASLWQLFRDDVLVRRGAYASLAILWFAAAWAEGRVLLFLPVVAAVVWVLRRHRGELDDDADLL